MLQPLYLLETDPAGKLVPRASARASWLHAVVVPRSVCVFEAVPCRGLAWHERVSFARLQGRRLAPFANTGFNACVKSGVLMLWLWDQAEVMAALNDLQLDPHKTRLWAEPLLQTRPAGSGQADRACAGGVDLQTLVEGAITVSVWQPAAAPLPAPALPRTWPWSRELAGQRLRPVGDIGAARRWSPATLLATACYASLVGAATYAAYWGAQMLAADVQLERLESEAQRSTRQLGDLADVRARSKSANDWVTAYARLATGLMAPTLLDTLAPVLERYGVVIREMEARGDEVRLSVVSAGSDIDLPGLLQGLSASPGFANVQLRTGVDFSQATFSMRVPGHLQTVAMPTTGGTP